VPIDYDAEAPQGGDAQVDFLQKFDMPLPLRFSLQT
jgi:hypothetical protein